jgi:hypothetical protein
VSCSFEEQFCDSRVGWQTADAQAPIPPHKMFVSHASGSRAGNNRGVLAAAAALVQDVQASPHRPVIFGRWPFCDLCSAVVVVAIGVRRRGSDEVSTGIAPFASDQSSPTDEAYGGVSLTGCTNALGTTLQRYPSLLQPTPSSAVDGTVSNGVRCGLVGPIVKVLLDANAASIFAQPAGSSYAFTLRVARNEYESIQVVCRSPSTRVAGVPLSVVLSTEARAAGIVLLPHSTRNYVVTTVSDCSGAHGSTPDILVPFEDPWYNQVQIRHDELPAGEAVSWWLDVFAPPSAPAASNTRIDTVSATGLSNPIALPFTLRVRNLTLPDVSPYASAFLYWGAPGHPQGTCALTWSWRSCIASPPRRCCAGVAR